MDKNEYSVCYAGKSSENVCVADNVSVFGAEHLAPLPPLSPFFALSRNASQPRSYLL